MADESLRIDKWLWFARLARTRTLAQKLAVSGCVRVNRQKNDSAARLVKVGDVLTIALGSGVRVLRIAATGARPNAIDGPSTGFGTVFRPVARIFRLRRIDCQIDPPPARGGTSGFLRTFCKTVRQRAAAKHRRN